MKFCVSVLSKCSLHHPLYCYTYFSSLMTAGQFVDLEDLDGVGMGFSRCRKIRKSYFENHNTRVDYSYQLGDV